MLTETPASVVKTSSRAERALFIRLALLLLMTIVGPTAKNDTSTSASTEQLLLRVVPLILIAVPTVLSIIAGSVDMRRLLRRPAIYWWAYATAALVGGTALGRYPFDFTVWKSAELLLAMLVIAVAASRCTFAQVERVVFRVLQSYLLLICVGAAIQPSSIRRIAGFFRLDSQFITPNKLAIAAGVYLILLMGRPDKRRSWRLAMALSLVVLSLSRSVLGLLLLGAPYFFDVTYRRRGVRRIAIALGSSVMAIAGYGFITNILTKGGAVGEDNILSFSGRTLKWGTAFDSIREWPFGWGVNGAFRDVFIPEYRGGSGAILGNVHSSAIESILSAGLLGGACWFLFWLYPLRQASPAIKSDPSYDRVSKAIVFVILMSFFDSGFVLLTGNALMMTPLVFASAAPRNRS